MADLRARLAAAEERAERAEAAAAADEQLRAFISRAHAGGARWGVVDDSGDRYEGFLASGATPSWYGVCQYANGDTYSGAWAAGKPEGFGECRFKHGNAYAGGWAGGGYEGDGVYTYANGDTFQGHWAGDRRSGTGVFTDAATGSRWEETYDNGVLTLRKPLAPRAAGAYARAKRPCSAAGARAYERSNGGNGGHDTTADMPPPPRPATASARRARRSAASSGGAAGSAPSRRPTTAPGAGAGRRMRRDAYLAMWAALDGRPDGRIRFGDVPWPSRRADLRSRAAQAEMRDVLLGLAPCGAGERRKRLREELMRWHPDRWSQRYRGRLEAADAPRILERATAVSQYVGQLYAQYAATQGANPRA